MKTMPRYVNRPALALAYVAAALAGLFSLLVPPMTLKQAFIVQNEFFHSSWAVLAIIGGTVGAYAAFSGRWRIERWAAPLAAGGVGGYAAIVWSLMITETSSRITQALIVTIAMMVFIDRSWYLARKAKQIRLIAASTAQVARQCK